MKHFIMKFESSSQADLIDFVQSKLYIFYNAGHSTILYPCKCRKFCQKGFLSNYINKAKVHGLGRARRIRWHRTLISGCLGTGVTTLLHDRLHGRFSYTISHYVA